MNIEIYYLTSSKKLDWVSEPIKDYLSRLPNFWKVSIQPIYTKHHQNKGASEILLQESKKIESAIGARPCLIALDKGGTQLSTEKFAQKMQQFSTQHTLITFLIGSAVGLSEQLIKKAEHVWSFSLLTLPHRLARLLLVEQIYRSYAFLNQHPYYK